MAYDEGLAETYRSALVDVTGVTEKKMMGGLCFFLNGNMLGGAHREKNGAGFFMFRVGKNNAAVAERIGGGNLVELGGRTMGGLYFVEADDCPHELFEQWKSLAISNALSLPPK